MALSLCTGLFLRAGATFSAEGKTATTAPTPDSASAPMLELVSVPPVGSSALLTGRVRNAASAEHRVAVYIYVFGWWTKPSWAAPLTQINQDGTWSTDIVTGGSDECATRIAAYLVPADYSPPLLSGESQLPAGLEQNSRGKAIIDRAALARLIRFSGFDWAVKSTGGCQWGPGPNYYSDSTENVWVDAQDRLHLRLTQRRNQWYCAEVALTRSLGYGSYRFSVETPLDNFDRHVVFGLFTWSDDPDFHHREIDIEFSKWSAAANPNNAQFVVQPFDHTQQLLAFRQPAGIQASTHTFTWQPDQVSFQSVRGTNAVPSQNTALIRQWTFSQASAIPPPGSESARVNLWLFNGVPPANSNEVEVVVSKFEFVPDSPRLGISPRAGQVVLAWPMSYPGFALERALSPTGPWQLWNAGTPGAGPQWEVLLAPTEPARFFRLRKD